MSNKTKTLNIYLVNIRNKECHTNPYFRTEGVKSKQNKYNVNTIET